MAQQVINIGTVANDDTGTPLRQGGDMINDNFAELYAAVNTEHTGDVTGLVDLTLATVNANVGSFNHPTLTVDGKGRVTAISTTPGTLPKFYSTTVDLAAGVITQLVTTITNEPWSILLLDTLTHAPSRDILNLQVSFALVGGVYVFDIYSTDALNDVLVKIMY